MLKKCSIRVEDYGLIATDPGYLFLEVLNREGLDLHNHCGGHGKCGRCRIVFHTEPPEAMERDRFFLASELLEQGCRLACFHQVAGDCSITIPEPIETELLDDL